jgi:hypothetical protein
MARWQPGILIKAVEFTDGRIYPVNTKVKIWPVSSGAVRPASFLTDLGDVTASLTTAHIRFNSKKYQDAAKNDRQNFGRY